jgi:putative phosphoribosyl transferase
LLLDLLTTEEKIDIQTRQLRLDIDLRSKRLVFVIDRIINNPVTKNLSIGLVGARTCAPAALVAAAERGAVSAIVSQ